MKQSAASTEYKYAVMYCSGSVAFTFSPLAGEEGSLMGA